MALPKTFEAKTNTKPGSVVEDKLKPTAEMHILVGGPYTLNGENHRYGHTALRVKIGSSDTTYDFGRYGETRGIFGESGDGILRVWSDFSSYIRTENALMRTTTGFVYAIFDFQAKAVTDYFNGQIAAGKPDMGKNRASMKVYRLATDYDPLAKNCTTLSMDGAKQAIKNIDVGSEKFIKPEGVLSTSERLALGAKGGADRLFLPANLQIFLTVGSPAKPIRVDHYGGH